MVLQRTAAVSRSLGLALLAICCSSAAMGQDGSPDISSAIGIQGGLCVEVAGKAPSQLAIPLAKTGRFLVQVLSAEQAAMAQSLSAQGVYGLASADQSPESGRLPYTEDLINLLIYSGNSEEACSLEEAQRVLSPDGILLVSPETFSDAALKAAGFVDMRIIQAGQSWLAARKPRPVEMDGWSHPRHSASGNAVSDDWLVDPPRRVRWVVGAQAEVPGIITDGGRNFYGGVLARDSYNGLRLWDHDLQSPKETKPFALKRLPPNIPSPIAVGNRLFAVSEAVLSAFDAATGDLLQEYPEAGQPRDLMCIEGVLVAVDARSINGVDADTGRRLWQFEAAEPRSVVAGDGAVYLLQGIPQRGDKAILTSLDLATGKTRWTRDEYSWSADVQRCVYHHGMVAFEVSSFSNDGPGNSLHVLAATDGSLIWERDFLPGMNHIRQARAMFVGDQLWVLEGGRNAEGTRQPITCVSLDPKTGESLTSHRAGLTHCFPPVATPRFMLAGELDMTDLSTGKIDANRITKAACSRDYGWVPANGLIYVTPKHCVCWPMLRGYAALAPQRPSGGVAEMQLAAEDFVLETAAEVPQDPGEQADDWPCYRHDAWRSGTTESTGPERADSIWAAELGDWPESVIADDWRENPFIKGPVTPPVIAGDLVFVARSDEHQVAALSVDTGELVWQYRANGRVDTAPTIHAGLCLFGTKSGWVYCLRAKDGQLVWRLRAAPIEERIVAYGQLESPWPVPGSVLAVGDRAYFAAGRQPFADGGILVFAVQVTSGKICWVKRHDTVPQQGFYECSALEFDNFDLLHRQADGVAMSRWVWNRESGEMSLARWDAFARLNTGHGSSMVPQGSWSYAPRHQARIPTYTHHRPLVVFRDNHLWGCMQGMQSVYRRDFDLENGESFNAHWITGWAASTASRNGELPWRSERLAENATWRQEIYSAESSTSTIIAMAMADNRLYLAGSNGDLHIASASDGKLLDKTAIPVPVWDGLAVAKHRLYVTTKDGQVLCLGEQ